MQYKLFETPKQNYIFYVKSLIPELASLWIQSLKCVNIYNTKHNTLDKIKKKKNILKAMKLLPDSFTISIF